MAGDEGGEAGGGWAREAGKGGEMGGGTREQCGSNKACAGLGCLENLTIGLIWLGDAGEAWGGWAREAGKGGEMGGGTREQCGSNKACTGSTFWGSLKNLTIGLTRRVGQEIGQGGGDGGSREVGGEVERVTRCGGL